MHGSGGVTLAPLAADEKWTWSLQQNAPRWTIGLRRGFDRRGGSRLHVRCLFRSPRSRNQVLCTPVGDRFDGKRFVGRNAVTPRTIRHRNLAIEHLRKTRHANPERRFPITLRNGPE